MHKFFVVEGHVRLAKWLVQLYILFNQVFYSIKVSLILSSGKKVEVCLHRVRICLHGVQLEVFMQDKALSAYMGLDSRCLCGACLHSSDWGTCMEQGFGVLAQDKAWSACVRQGLSAYMEKGLRYLYKARLNVLTGDRAWDACAENDFECLSEACLEVFAQDTTLSVWNGNVTTQIL